MAALEALVAAAAAADMDVELAMDGAARDLDLVLVGDVGFLDEPAATWAGIGQGCLVDFVDVGGWLPMGLGAVIPAGLAAGPLRLGLRRPFGKRPGLALSGAEGRVELTAKSLVLGLQVVDSSLKRLAVDTPDRFHAGIIRSSRKCSGAGGRQRTVQLELGPLIKYVKAWCPS